VPKRPLAVATIASQPAAHNAHRTLADIV
jgi:hypothetical protein